MIKWEQFGGGWWGVENGGAWTFMVGVGLENV